jgi:pantoate--beta-alanine ligase
MNVFTTIAELGDFLANPRKQGKSIGFVPTMGALHAGHIALVEAARKENDITVCSIFVNPIQFTDSKDLEKYPRTPEADIKMLEAAGCDALFMPSVKEMYPAPDTRTFNFGALEKVMEGAHRPGHFNGVAIVVSKLFDIVLPDKAYFGQKDFQQLAIVKAMVKQLGLKVNVIGHPIVREADGLAMSSRNTRLSAQERKEAALIPDTLFKVKEMAKNKTVSELKAFAKEQIAADPNMQLDYFEIADTETLQPVQAIDPGNSAVACIAVKLGPVRLIDNVILFA